MCLKRVNMAIGDVSHVDQIPLFRVPQTSQRSVAFSLPVDSCRRFPQSVQKINDPIADMLAGRQSANTAANRVKVKTRWNEGRLEVDVRVCSEGILSRRAGDWRGGQAVRAAAGIIMPGIHYAPLYHSEQSCPLLPPSACQPAMPLDSLPFAPRAESLTSASVLRH